ncbi:MAG: hypothetical protein LBE35_02290 [Clostridiales bacterium]|jgi:hypothetical protein|nr:hypothetical protein [Clostridiales bacterium]
MTKSLFEKISKIGEVMPDDIDLQMIKDFEGEPNEGYIDWEAYKSSRKERKMPVRNFKALPATK